MTYFRNCKTAEELKESFRKLCKELHPDANPGKDTTEAFKTMKAEFEKAFGRLKNIHANAEGETYQKETSETAAEFMDLIESLILFRDISIELCGSWVWVTGNTYAHKEELKALKFRWSSKKAAWYFHKGEFHKTRRALSLDEIREHFGSVSLSRKAKAIA